VSQQPHPFGLDIVVACGGQIPWEEGGGSVQVLHNQAVIQVTVFASFLASIAAESAGLAWGCCIEACCCAKQKMVFRDNSTGAVEAAVVEVAAALPSIP